MNPNTIATSIRSTRAQNIANKYGVIDINPEDHPFWAKLLNGKSFGDVYQLGMSMADSAAVLAMSPILGSYGTVLLGGSAGTQGVITALENGATDEQALAMGVLNGFFEMFFEKYSLETLLSSNGRRFIDALWRQAVAEGSEELFTSAANNVADIIVMAEKSGYMKNVADYISDGFSESEAMQKALLDMGIDMGWDFVGGLISGGIMGSGGKVASNSVQQLQNYKTGKNIQSTDGGVDALLNSANEIKAVSSEQMQKTLTTQMDKVNQNSTARNVGQLYATVQSASNQENAAVNKADVAKSLRSKRVYSKEVDGIAEAITARLNHKDLTRPQQSLLSFALNSSAVRDTISEFINRKKTTTQPYSQNIQENMRPIQESSDTAKLQQYQILKQRYHERSEATDVPEQHERVEKSDFIREHGNVAQNNQAKKKVIAKTSRSGIMKVDTGGNRNETPLTDAQIRECVEYAVALGVDRDKVRYGECYNTAYGSVFDVVYIGTDAYPAPNGRSANQRLSYKAALAHEIIGHRETYLKGTSLWDVDEVLDEVQASIRAAIFTEDLSQSDRMMLIRDAIERLRKSGRSIRGVKHLLDIETR